MSRLRTLFSRRGEPAEPGPTVERQPVGLRPPDWGRSVPELEGNRAMYRPEGIYWSVMRQDMMGYPVDCWWCNDEPEARELGRLIAEANPEWSGVFDLELEEYVPHTSWPGLYPEYRERLA